MNDLTPRTEAIPTLSPLDLASITAAGPGMVQVGDCQLSEVAALDMIARLSMAVAESRRMAAEEVSREPWRDVRDRLDAQWVHARPVCYAHAGTRAKDKGMAMRVADGRKQIVLLRTSTWSIARLMRHGDRWAGFVQTANPDLTTPAWSPTGQHFYLDLRIHWAATTDRVSLPLITLASLPLTDGCGRLVQAANIGVNHE